ncbi:MAG: DUF4382 domain-containing protein [Deltaproteobacteria bacterium]|nr:DUF4382 domain-containing protein [Deltaproteobacteria bacterium]
MKTDHSLEGWSVCRLLAMLLLCAGIMAGCGSGSGQSAGVGTGGTGSSVGKVSIDITDAPAMDYSHVYVTVIGVAFHTSKNVGFDSYSTARSAGWKRLDLPIPKTIDLAQLANGAMYADGNAGASLFNNLDLPVGNYQQIRIFLASTEDAYTGSVPGLSYNNEVQLVGDTAHYPLRIPTADEGIRLIPESPVVVTAGGSVKIALDFNLNNDVVEVTPNGTKEFIIKPRLGYFDMNSVGAVKGTVSFGNLSTSRIVIKAQQVASGVNYRIVRRWTGVDRSTGRFNLYPLPVFGNATTATYDILLRGRNLQTAIVKGVKVHKGTTPSSGAVDLGTITMQPGGEYSAQLGVPMHPTGSWMSFYQSIAGDPIPFEVRYRHLDPYGGKFGKAVELSTGPIQVATHTPGQALTFAADATSQGLFSAVADAPGYFARGAAMAGITGVAGQAVTMNNLSANAPQVSGGAAATSVSMIFDMTPFGSGRGPGMGMGGINLPKPNKGQLFVTHGGMIVDSLGTLTGDAAIGSAMHNGGGAGNTVAIGNIPGSVAGAFYGVYGLGWGNGVIAAGSTRVDMSAGNTTAVIRMR